MRSSNYIDPIDLLGEDVSPLDALDGDFTPMASKLSLSSDTLAPLPDFSTPSISDLPTYTPPPSMESKLSLTPKLSMSPDFMPSTPTEAPRYSLSPGTLSMDSSSSGIYTGPTYAAPSSSITPGTLAVPMLDIPGTTPAPAWQAPMANAPAYNPPTMQSAPFAPMQPSTPPPSFAPTPSFMPPPTDSAPVAPSSSGSGWGAAAGGLGGILSALSQSQSQPSSAAPAPAAPGYTYVPGANATKKAPPPPKASAAVAAKLKASQQQQATAQKKLEAFRAKKGAAQDAAIRSMPMAVKVETKPSVFTTKNVLIGAGVLAALGAAVYFMKGRNR